MELSRPKIESRDPIFFTGTRARSRISRNDRLFPRGSEFEPNPKIPASPVIHLRPWPAIQQGDCLALICVNHAFLRMVRKYELITHFPVVYADLRAVRKFAMILVWCPACTPVRLHHSPWAGASLGFLVRKKHVIIVQVLVSYCQQIEL